METRRVSLDEALKQTLELWKAGRAAEAEATCRAILEQAPGNPDALHLLGVMAQARGDLDFAIASLEMACAWPQAPSLFHGNLAELYRQARRPSDAEAAARRATDMDAGNASAWNTLGIVLQESQRLEEARTALERACVLSPNVAEIHNNLGNTFGLLGDLDRAKTYYERAAELNPRSAEVHNNLARVLCEMGDTEAAAAECARALELDPTFADAYLTSAIIERSRGRFLEAGCSLDEFLKRNPNDARGLNERARIWLRLDKATPALEAAIAGVAADPQNAEAQLVLGQALQSFGRDDEALAAFDRAQTLQPSKAGVALVNKAGLLMELGRFDDARAATELALAAQPHLASAWAARAKLKKFESNDPDLAEMERLLRQTQDYFEQTLFHFTLGNAYLQAGDAERAFEHFHAGNRMERATFTYDVDAVVKWFDDIGSAFPASSFSGPAHGAQSDRPIFVIGMPRSGTSLIEQILSAHPAVYGAGELTVLNDIVDRIRAPDGTLLSYAEFVPALKHADLLRLGTAYLKKVVELAPDKLRVVDKLPANFVHAGLIGLILPGAHVIHVKRDPVDTCLSIYTTWFRNATQPFAYDLSELGRFYKGYERLTAHWRSVIPPDRFIEVQYEEVVADLESQARRLVAFCGMEWDEACLSFHKTERPVRTASANQVRQPLYRTSVGRWKRYAKYLEPLLTALGEKSSG